MLILWHKKTWLLDVKVLFVFGFACIVMLTDNSMSFHQCWPDAMLPILPIMLCYNVPPVLLHGQQLMHRIKTVEIMQFCAFVKCLLRL